MPLKLAVVISQYQRNSSNGVYFPSPQKHDNCWRPRAQPPDKCCSYARFALVPHAGLALSRLLFVPKTGLDGEGGHLQHGNDFLCHAFWKAAV